MNCLLLKDSLIMKNTFDDVKVTYSEYAYFKDLPKTEQIQYFFELYDAALAETRALDLSAFFESIHNELQKPGPAEFPEEEYDQTSDWVDVLIDDEIIMIESNSLRSCREVAMRFAESGYILRRDKTMEKSFRKDKNTRYMRIYQIIDQVSTICLN